MFINWRVSSRWAAGSWIRHSRVHLKGKRSKLRIIGWVASIPLELGETWFEWSIIFFSLVRFLLKTTDPKGRAPHAGVFRGARFSSLSKGEIKKRALLKRLRGMLTFFRFLNRFKFFQFIWQKISSQFFDWAKSYSGFLGVENGFNFWQAEIRISCAAKVCLIWGSRVWNCFAPLWTVCLLIRLSGTQIL